MTAPPQKIDVEPERLVVSWSDEHVSHYDLVALRRACMCAPCTHRRDQGEPVWPTPGAPEKLAVVGAELVGGWGLNVQWNDTHETGVYTWETLIAWCECELCRATTKR
jgi:DUF971 family protein